MGVSAMAAWKSKGEGDTLMPYAKDTATLCKGFIATHGYQRFAELAEALRANTMPRRLSVEFGISVQTAVVLRRRLGQVRSTYLLDPSVDALLIAGEPVAVSE